MNIVVLDGYTLNPGDLSWDGLQALGDCRIYDRTSPEEVSEKAVNSEILLTNKTVVSAGTIQQLQELKYIGVMATGYNIVDILAAKKAGIIVTNVPTYGTQSVAQNTFAHILNLTNRVGEHAQSVAQGDWVVSKDWSYWKSPLIELAGLKLGIIGFGRIGQAVAKIGVSFGMEILFHDVYAPGPIPDGFVQMDLNRLFSESDIISLHCPLTNETKHIVNSEKLNLMKKSAFLINTSRGLLIDEKALADALNSGLIAGAGLDVLSVEPPTKNNPLLKAKDCFITPHYSWATKSSRERLMKVVIENIISFLKNKPQNVVNH